MPEYAVHGCGAAFDDGTDLLAVDHFGDGRAVVADQPGDLLDGDPVVGEQGHEAVPQLARCPVVGREPGSRRDSAKPAADVGCVELGAGLGSEDEAVTFPPGAGGTPLLVLASTVASRGARPRSMW